MNLFLACRKKNRTKPYQRHADKNGHYGSRPCSYGRTKTYLRRYCKRPLKTSMDSETALAGLPIIFNRCSLTKETDFVCLAIQANTKQMSRKSCRTYHAEIFHIPEDLPHNVIEALKEVNKRIKENSDKEKAVCSFIKKLGNENKSNLASWKETSENILYSFERREKNIQSQGGLQLLKGLCLRKNFLNLTQKVHEMLGEKAIVLEKQRSRNCRIHRLVEQSQVCQAF